MDENSRTGHSAMNRLNKLIYCTRPYPLFDQIVRIYVAVVLLFQVLFQISPVMTFFTGTPLYSVQTYLGLLGGVLLLVDVFTSKRVWSGSSCLLLYGILLCAGLASVRAMEYGIKENLFKLCWATIQFALVYSLAHRMTKQELLRYAMGLYGVLVCIWLWGCCVSLYQYLNQISYWELVNPLAKDASYNRQGFFDNRLFGIFHTLNHAAYISLLFVIAGSFLAFSRKGILIKITTVLANLILLSHILLTGSRSAFISMVACVFSVSWMLLYSRSGPKGVKRIILPLVAAVVLSVLSLWTLQGFKQFLGQVPYYYRESVQETEATTESTTQKETEDTTNPEEEVDPDTNPTQVDEETEPKEDLLERDYLENDQSNGRLDIWGDYVSIYRDVGAIGLSPGYYMDYIREHHPELYIVEYIRLYYPAKYQSGFIYHVHSGYLMVYVSAGLCGTLLLAAFVMLCVIRVFKKIFAANELSCIFVCSFALVLAVAISAAFDEGIFFQNNPQTTVFWLALGVLMKQTQKKTALCAKQDET